MNIGLYFGSFNPIHTGHCIIANHVLNNTSLSQVWFVVTPQNPFKQARSLLNEYDRLHLVQLAIQDEPNLKASDAEFQLPRPSYTINTLTHLKDKYPGHEFSIIIGSDSYQNLPTWKNSDVIVFNYDIYVYLRNGFPIDKKEQVRLTLLNAPLLQISSTHIREIVRDKKSIRYLVPDRVKEEIERNGYYR